MEESWSDNCLFNIEVLQHFLWLRKLSRSTRKASEAACAGLFWVIRSKPLLQSGWENSFEKTKETTHLIFVVLSKAVLSGLFKKKHVFVLLLRKTQKPHFQLFLLHHVISPFAELHDNNLYLLLHTKLRVKKCTPSLLSQSVVGQCAPKW